MINLQMTSLQYNNLLSHLLESDVEQVAFLQASYSKNKNNILFVCNDLLKIPPSGFDFQSDYHISLSDETRQSIIKSAWDSGYCLIETHSHINNDPVQFSYSDMKGFNEFVPHIRWRLNNLPYIALVFNKISFDALVWHEKNENFIGLDCLLVDQERIFPTNHTIDQVKGSKFNEKFK